MVLKKDFVAIVLVLLMSFSFVSYLGIGIVQASSSLALDGSGSSGVWNGGSYTVTLSTSSSPDVIVAYVTTYVGKSTISAASISSAHLTFSKRILMSNDGNENLEEWYAVAASPLSNEAVTVTLSASGVSAASIFGISGANTASPFDPNSALPATATFGNSVPQVTGASTSNANDMIVSGYGTKGSVGPVVAGTGFTTIHQGAQPQVIGAEYGVVSSTLSSATVGWTNNANFGAIIVDAVEAGSAPPTTTTSTATSGSTTSSSSSSSTVSSTSPSTTTSSSTTSSSSTSSSSTSTITTSSAPLALDGSGTGGAWNGGSFTVTLSTGSSPDVIIAFVTTYVGNSPISATSITSAHLTFTKRALTSYPGNENLEEWYAISSGPLSSEVITVTLSGSAHSTASIFGIGGANTASPFDPNPSLPTTNTIESVTPPTCADSNLSTSNANDMIICAYGTKGGLGSVTTTSGFALISHLANPQVIGTEYEVVSSTLSSASIAWVNNGNAGAGIADAVVAGSTSTSTTTTTASTTSASSSSTTSQTSTTSSSSSSSTSSSSATSTSTGSNQDWPSLTLNNNNSRYQPSAGVTSSNVGSLTQRWFFPTSYSVTSTPVVLNGNVYFADWGGNVYSVNIATHTQNWKYHVSHAISSSLLLANGLVYVGWGPYGPTNVMALSQSTGTPVWSTTLHTTMSAVWASPIVYNGRLFIGVADSDNNSEGVSAYKGEIDALDAMTGNLDWKFQTAIGTLGGASVWGSVAVDPALDSIYFGTGNSFGSGSGPATLYGYAIISLSASTGNLNWYHQVYTDTTTGGDLDFGSSPNLFTLSYNGNTYRAIGIGAKDGVYYVLDRTNGILLETRSVGTLDNMGILGLAGFFYPSTPGNPELFIPSSNYPTCNNCKGVVEAWFPSSNSVAWDAYSPGLIVGSVTVVPGAVLFGDIYGNFYAIKIADGSVLFHTQITPYGINGGITVAEGYVFFGNGAQPTSNAQYGLYAFAPSGIAAPTHSNSLSTTTQNWSPVAVVLLTGILSLALMALFRSSKSGANRK